MLEIGITGKKEIVVTPEMSAAKVGSGLLDVFATPMMIALLEETCHTSVSSYLEEGQATVGTKIDVEHLAATPIGMKVYCQSELTAIDRRKLTFSVTIFDEKEKIGCGTHERFIVNSDKFMQKASAKLQ